MADIEKYRIVLRKLLEQIRQLAPPDDEVETQMIIDPERDHIFNAKPPGSKGSKL